MSQDRNDTKVDGGLVDKYIAAHVQAIQPGDVIIELKYNKENPSLRLNDTARNAAHAMISLGAKDVAHAYPQIGVAVQDIYGDYDQSGVIEKDRHLGCAVVLRCKMDGIGEYCSRYSPSSFTPFVYAGERRQDDVKNDGANKLIEFFRAFRAFQRIEDRKPLSKKKGMCCSEFASYLMKAAMIKSIFPNGLPDDVRELLGRIEVERKERHNKKLDKVDVKEFIEFESLVKKHLEKTKLNQKGFEYLYRTVKGKNVSELCQSAIDNPVLWDMRYFCYIGSSSPHAMTEELRQQLGKSDKVVINSDHLKEVVTQHLAEKSKLSSMDVDMGSMHGLFSGGRDAVNQQQQGSGDNPVHARKKSV